MNVSHANDFDLKICRVESQHKTNCNLAKTITGTFTKSLIRAATTKNTGPDPPPPPDVETHGGSSRTASLPRHNHRRPHRRPVRWLPRRPRPRYSRAPADGCGSGGSGVGCPRPGPAPWRPPPHHPGGDEDTKVRAGHIVCGGGGASSTCKLNNFNSAELEVWVGYVKWKMLDAYVLQDAEKLNTDGLQGCMR